MRGPGRRRAAQGAGAEREQPPSLALGGFRSVASSSFILGPAPCGEVLFLVCPLSGPHVAGRFPEADTSLDAETNIDSESTSTQGISEERDMMLSYGLPQSVSQESDFPETCELEKYQEIPTEKNTKRKDERILCARKPFRYEECGRCFSFVR
ncbi:unnamed protein product [Nyctereutes procyonoides]|uniref:(raccoon dog) hypothetical protein n=1 Tax=Nyctereutes procyonoides TaxID=34880 RepID=A0A811ZK95_NYCPR|nr:unnamed protein product [Nyctereutes procyonoides]